MATTTKAKPEKRAKQEQIIRVCCGIGCVANGAHDVVKAFVEAIEERGLDNFKIEPHIKTTGCNGLCERGVLVTILPEGGTVLSDDAIVYTRVKPKDVNDILDSVQTGEKVKRLIFRQADDFYEGQVFIARRNLGVIDPTKIEDYLANHGYEALRRALSMTPEQVIEEIETSGIRGRGGAGFPAGRKWRAAAENEADQKYMLCNGDEGDPGAFMDRSIMEGDPHSVIEGLAIGAYAIGATRVFLYIRDEYEQARHAVGKAIEDAHKAGYLGKDILGSGFDFDCEIVRGGGAFVCGESSALIASIEGKIGEPRPKYVRSSEKGLWDKPTVLNNAETLATIPYIMQIGGQEYAKIGAPGNTGTKVFAMVGQLENTGLVEVPMGISLRDLIYKIGGGVKGGRPFKAVQTGGPSGGCLPESELDTPVDFDHLNALGTIMGSGGMIVMDDRSCMVDVARYYINFLSEESCGQCTPCREGLRWMLDILTDICDGKGREGDIELLERIAKTVEDASLCSLGKTAPYPVLSTIRFFRDEYEEHIRDHVCRAGVCHNLTEFYIDPDACTGCGLCSRSCPADCISGERKEPHVIDTEKCIVCGSCRTVCHFDAVLTRKPGRKGGAA